MPFQSEKQRRYLHANHPEIAKRWERDYAHGGILDIGESEEIISDDGNDIELTAYNAAFDDPNDLSTGVKTLFQAKDGGTPQLAKKSKDGKRPGYQGPHGDGGWSPGVSHSGAPASTGSDRGPRDDPDRFGPTKDTTPSDGGMGAKEQYIQTQYTSPEAIAAKTRRELRDIIARGPGSPIEKYDTPEQHLADTPGDLDFKSPQHNTYKSSLNVDYKRTTYEQTLADQKAKLKKMGLEKLSGLGLALLTMLAIGVPLGDALKALPKTISLSKKDLATIVKESYPVMKAKKAHINALQDYKTSLLGQVDTLNPNEMKSKTGKQISNITNEINELTQTRDEDEDTRGGPELPPQLGGTSTEEMATEYVEPIDWMSGLRENQARKKAYDEKIAREENPIVGTTEMDIIALGNSGGLANLFRVKNK